MSMEIDIEEIRKEADARIGTASMAGKGHLTGVGIRPPSPANPIVLSQEELDVVASVVSTKVGEEETGVAIEKPVLPSNRFKGSDAFQTAPVGGFKFDAGKPKWELAPFDAFEEIVNVLTWASNKDIRGSKAYPERNWEEGMKWGRVFGAMIRHAWKWWFGKMTGGSTIDEESGLSHAAHFFTCAGFLVAYEKRGMVEFDDRPSLPKRSEPLTGPTKL